MRMSHFKYKFSKGECRRGLKSNTTLKISPEESYFLEIYQGKPIGLQKKSCIRENLILRQSQAFSK